MSSAVSITGIGLVTPLGRSAQATWDALLTGRFISDHSSITNASIYEIAQSAASEAIADAAWDVPCGMGGSPMSSADQGRAAPATKMTALIVGTSKGPIKSWIDRKEISFGLSGVSDALQSLMPFNNSLTLSAACASGLHALIRGVLMIENGEADRALVVAAEASVHPLFLASFQRLGVLARPAIGCRPFDENREGFLMSEAAAAVCLERKSSGIYASIDRMALGADATHLTGSDPEATTLRRLLRHVIAGKAFDLIHAHGTGTVVNDAIELNAIDDSLASRSERPILYSHKGALGHSLGAAGLVAVVLNAMAHRESIVPPNVRTTRPMSSDAVTISATAERRSIKRSAVMASGFGGAVAAVGLRAPV